MLRMFAVHFDRSTKTVKIAAHSADKLMQAKRNFRVRRIDLVGVGRRAQRCEQQNCEEKMIGSHKPSLSLASDLSKAWRDNGNRPKRCPSAIAGLGFAPWMPVMRASSVSK